VTLLRKLAVGGLAIAAIVKAASRGKQKPTTTKVRRARKSVTAAKPSGRSRVKKTKTAKRA